MRSWHVVAHMVTKREFLSTFICAYYAFCFVVFPELKISVSVLALDYGLIKFYFAWPFITLCFAVNDWKAPADEKGNHLSLNLSLRVLEQFYLPSFFILSLHPCFCNRKLRLIIGKKIHFSLSRSLVQIFRNPQLLCACCLVQAYLL